MSRISIFGSRERKGGLNLCLSILIGLALLAGSITAVSAAEIKLKGYMDFGFFWNGNRAFQPKSNSDGRSFSRDDIFDVKQRLRWQVDFVAGPDLSGTAQFEIGDVRWGRAGDTWGAALDGRGRGGALGTDGVIVETRYLYLDWVVLETDLSLRMGLIPYALPNFANGRKGGSAIIDDDLAGLTASYSFNENISASLTWLRPWNPFANGAAKERARWDHDAIDLFALTVPLTFLDNGLEITPWAMYGAIGQVDTDYSRGGDDIGLSFSGTGLLGSGGQAWWTGISIDLEYWEPAFFAIDLMYGAYDSAEPEMYAGYRRADNMPDYGASGAYLGNADNRRGGWALSAMLGLKLDDLKPMFFGWYGSGIKDAYADNLFDGLMPVVSPDWGYTSFGWTNYYGNLRYGIVNGNNIIGTWGVGIGLENIKILPELSTSFRAVYFRGTNDSSLGRMANFHDRKAGQAGTHLYTTKDHGLEFNLDTVYELMSNLSLYNQLGYIHLDIADVWNQAHTVKYDNKTRDAWEAAVGLRYTF